MQLRNFGPTETGTIGSNSYFVVKAESVAFVNIAENRESVAGLQDADLSCFWFLEVSTFV